MHLCQNALPIAIVKLPNLTYPLPTMCFSASASFTASAILTGIGIYSIHKQKNTPEWPLGIIPFIFAIQQAVEGFLWLSLTQWENAGATFLSGLFLFFAFFWWPAYMPWVAAKLETDPARKKTHQYIWYSGLAFGLILYSLFLLKPVSAYINGSSICYAYYPYLGTAFNSLPWIVAPYVGFTVLIGIVSKNRIFKLFSVAAGILMLIAWYFHHETFTSTWCFFAAVLSLILLFPTPKSAKRRWGA